MNKKILLLTLFTLAGATLWVRSLPDYLLSPPETSQVLKVYDRHGIRIRSHAPGETYDWIPLKEVPPDLIRLIVLAEDRNFYAHSGVDLLSLLRSTAINLRHFRILTGASTITQQVYRVHHRVPRNWWGKIQTVVGALLLERRYPKDLILAHYLNSLPYGKQLVGVRRASEVLFGKSLPQLALSEMAVLAVAPRAPSYLLNHSPLLTEKRNHLLRQYAATSGLSPDVLAYELKTPVAFEHDYSGRDNYHYIQRIFSLADFTKKISSGEVHTTLDSYLQKEVASLVRAHLRTLRKNNAHNSSVIVLDNHSGDVLVYLGATGIDGGKGEFIDGLFEARQPGSALKPFTYALALEKGRELTSLVPDIPTYYRSGGGQYLPRNYDRDFTGPRLMREALANSLNLPAVALVGSLGVEPLYQYLKSFGLLLPRGPEHYGVGLTLGNAELTPFSLARSFTAFHDGERITEPRFFPADEIRHVPVPLRKDTAYRITDILSDPVARREAFGEGNIFELPFEVAVKTGTSTDFRDNWAVGVNRMYTVLTWVGNMNQEPMKRVSGISGAGPILAETFKILMKDKYITPRTRPGTLVKREICALSGMAPSESCPHRKSELVTILHTLEACSFHRRVVVRNCGEQGDDREIPVTVYPEEYQKFSGDRPQWTMKGQIHKMCANETAEFMGIPNPSSDRIAIQRPLPESVFAIDPNIPGKLQRLGLQLNRSLGVKSVSWKIGEKIFTEKSSGLDWQMEKGKHEIEATVELQNGSRVTTEKVTVTIL